MKSRILRTGALLTTVVASAALLTGCAGGAGSDGAIQMQTGFAQGTDQLKTLTELTDAYEQQNPDVKIDLIPSSTQYEQDLKVKLASRDVPDIWMTHGWSRDRYAQFLAPLQDEPWAAKVNPQLDAAMRDESGAIYALPVDTDIAGILYNADVLRDAGVDPASLTTWDAFDAAAAKIHAKGTTVVQVSGKANGPAGNLVDWIAPGQYTDAQLEGLSDGTFDDGAYTKVLDMIAGWVDAGYVNPDYSSATQDDMSKALGAGQAAFVFQQNSVANNALRTSPDASLGFMPVPSSTGEPYLIGGEMNAFGVSKTSPHLAQAKAFLSYLAEPVNDAELAAAGGSAPGLTDAASDLGPLQGSYDAWVTQAKTPLVPYFDRVHLPNGMWNTLVTTTDSVITGQSDVTKAVAQVEQDFTSLHGQGK
ncbi:ABC transporter substrate-binding protein [Clavibacter californiensis]|jgi:raffinose/stachyose/melibiose transport system substrate-binding protein|uniref:Carbohydrate ABC transporter substrate-binding protein n=1 Tax=Clavibacter californiensis TaxID=1401995 RepID=A0ABX9N680_9MICO|nr:ABC transporter substrate-binding protein [Clavibacter californiensis]RII92708.1 carbohydrate ABC transporter substrate-binding protein [Clavibacter californiensis]UKF80783.1 ABC transporter substrate-binding protein [Clavibacter californiensis]